MAGGSGRAALKAGLAAAALAAVPLGAARAETVFVGDTIVTAASPQCVRAVAVGETARITYRPTGVGLANGVDSYLAYIGSRASYAMTSAGKPFQQGASYAGQALSSILNLKTETGPVTGWEQRPARISPDAASIELTATLGNFWAVAGCTVTIRTNLIRVRANETDDLD